MVQTRRRMLKLSASAIAAAAIAGCLADEADEEPAAGDDEADDHDDDDHDDDHDHDDEADDHDHDDDDHDDDHDHDDEELEDAGLSEFELIDRETDEMTALVHGDHWDYGLPPVPLDGQISIGAYIEDDEDEEIELGDEYELRAEVMEGAQEGIVDFEFHGDHVDILGEEEGITEIVFQLWHDDHSDYDTPPIDVEVAEDPDGVDDQGDEHGHDDDHDDHDHDDEADDHDHDDDDHDDDHDDHDDD
jgi:hypothetical protein